MFPLYRVLINMFFIESVYRDGFVNQLSARYATLIVFTAYVSKRFPLYSAQSSNRTQYVPRFRHLGDFKIQDNLYRKAYILNYNLNTCYSLRITERIFYVHVGCFTGMSRDAYYRSQISCPPSFNLLMHRFDFVF